MRLQQVALLQGKAAQVVGILGDVNNDNQVDISRTRCNNWLLYTLERVSLTMCCANQGNMHP